MRALVVFESMYGNTRLIAEGIAAGLGGDNDVEVVPVQAATSAKVDAADLIVVGGPTHAHGLTTGSSRRQASAAGAKPGAAIRYEATPTGPGLREWLRDLAKYSDKKAATFDTRFDGPPVLTGSAAKGIGRRLKSHGCVMVAAPESFLIDKRTVLNVGEAERAQAWGRELARLLAVAR